MTTKEMYDLKTRRLEALNESLRLMADKPFVNQNVDAESIARKAVMQEITRIVKNDGVTVDYEKCAFSELMGLVGKRVNANGSCRKMLCEGVYGAKIKDGYEIKIRFINGRWATELYEDACIIVT